MQVGLFYLNNLAGTKQISEPNNMTHKIKSHKSYKFSTNQFCANASCLLLVLN